MAEVREIYKCEICGNIVEVLHGGKGTLVCCGQPMKKLVENTTDASLEKHVPVLEPAENGTIVKIGSVPHPMEETHFIEWVEVRNKEGKTVRVFLKPGDKPEVFVGWKIDSIVEAREYCNLHGLWKTSK